MKIAIDLDNTINDLMTPWLAWYDEKYDDGLSIDDITDWDITRFVNCGDEIYDFLSIPGSFLNTLIQPGAASVMEWLNDRFDTYIVTACTFNGKNGRVFEEKSTWIQNHLPFINLRQVIFAHDKSVIDADYMIDDGLHNLRNFRGTGIVFDRPWNRKTLIYRIYRRVYNWLDIKWYFDRVINERLSIEWTTKSTPDV